MTTLLKPGSRVMVKGYHTAARVVEIGLLQAHVEQPITHGVVDLWVPLAHLRPVPEVWPPMKRKR